MGSGLMAEVVIPGLDDFPLTAAHDLADLPHLLGIETPDVGERDRVHPQLGIAIGDFHVDMDGFEPLVAEEEEPVARRRGTRSAWSGRHSNRRRAAGRPAGCPNVFLRPQRELKAGPTRRETSRNVAKEADTGEVFTTNGDGSRRPKPRT